ncbi:MAG: LCP family protein, partial [Chloroflexota bacterium]|nr:LCP family protein [Chloroflexota bacterium]
MPKTKQKKSSDSNKWGLWVVFGVALLAAMALVGLISYAAAREFAYSPIEFAKTATPRPGFTPQYQTESGEETMPPLPYQEGQAPSPLKTPQIAPTLTPWNGTERVTVLVMGLDYRDWAAGSGASRTDTMMLLTMDPISKTAGLLSVPRDLWVPIPGFKHGKINTAYVMGASYNLPGGGPGLAVKTVETVIGVPIHYYAVVDFQAFIRFIDELGGVKLDIPYEIEVDLLASKNKTLKPGVQTLPGDYALAYARNRHTGDGDFDRARRQQQVILGIRNRILEFKLLPNLIKKSPTLYRELVSGVHTNLRLDEIIQLALLAKQIPDESIRQGVIDTRYVAYGWSPDNLSILIPYPDRIRLLRDEIFNTSGSLAPLAPGSEQERMSLEAASILVQNSADESDLAARAAAYLRSQGAAVIEIGQVDQDYPKTIIIDHVGRPYTMRYLVSWLGIETRQIKYEYDPTSPVDIEVFLGDDWAAKE